MPTCPTLTGPCISLLTSKVKIQTNRKYRYELTLLYKYWQYPFEPMFVLIASDEYEGSSSVLPAFPIVDAI